MRRRLNSVGAVALHLDDCVGANDRALAAACTVAVGLAGWVVALCVGLLGDYEAALRADHHAQAAAFAFLDINNYLAGHISYVIPAQDCPPLRKQGQESIASLFYWIPAFAGMTVKHRSI